MKIFNAVQIKGPKRSNFDLSHERKQSMNMGLLYPCLVQEVLPGDKFTVQAEVLVRLQALLSPVMHRMNVFTHYFFVPNRLVWTNWEKFITGGDDGLQTATLPKLTLNNANKALYGEGSLADYMGIPVVDIGTTVTEDLAISALPFRAYAMIFDEYYRDQNLMTKLDYSKGDTVAPTDYNVLLQLRKRCWEKDYFTSALPWTQRGGDVGVPLNVGVGDITYTVPAEVYPASGGSYDAASAFNADSFGTHLEGQKSSAPENAIIKNIDSIETEMLINDLRVASRLQEWLERNARVGSRYIEQIWSHFKKRSSDARLQRPEYLGGGKQSLVISEVLNTAGDEAQSQPGGMMYGHGVSVGNTNGFRREFEEHGYIIGIMSIMPRSNYFQGIDKMWLKDDKLEWAWPEFAQLGEQEIDPRELYHDYVNPTPGTAFGYQSRYAEYKYQKSSIHGAFRSSLAFWHMARQFADHPDLNSSFVECTPTTDIFASIAEADGYCLAYIFNKINARRPLPYFNNPKL